MSTLALKACVFSSPLMGDREVHVSTLQLAANARKKLKSYKSAHFSLAVFNSAGEEKSTKRMLRPAKAGKKKILVHRRGRGGCFEIFVGNGRDFSSLFVRPRRERKIGSQGRDEKDQPTRGGNGALKLKVEECGEPKYTKDNFDARLKKHVFQPYKPKQTGKVLTHYRFLSLGRHPGVSGKPCT